MRQGFPNVYVKKLVKDADSKACFLCHKPSSIVLLTISSPEFEFKDFFYVCQSHLADTNFCTEIFVDEVSGVDKSNEVNKLKLELESRKSNVKKLQDQLAQDNATLNKVVNYFNKKEEQPDLSSKSVTTLIADAKKALVESQTSLTSMEREFRKYQLDKTFYRSRMGRLREKIADEKRLEFLSNPNSFPRVDHLAKPGA